MAVPVHPLRVWLDEQGMSVEHFRQSVGAGQPITVYRWLNGERIPAPGYMVRIIALTGGMVTADDFYGFEGFLERLPRLPDLPRVLVPRVRR